MKSGHIWIAVMAAAMMAYLFCGCATYDVDLSNPARMRGDAYGFFRNITVTQTVRTIDAKTGQPVETTVAISSASTSAEIMGAFKDLVGTLSSAAKEWKP